MTLLITTVPGLEDLALREALEYLEGGEEVAAALKEGMGRALVSLKDVDSEWELATKLVARSLMAEKVYVVLLERKVRSLGEIKSTFGDDTVRRQLFKLITPFQFFSIEAERIGASGFSSMELAGCVGEALQDIFPAREAPQVSLDDPDIEFRAEVENGIFRLAVNLTFAGSLRNRPYRKYIHPSMLNPIIANAMITLVGVREGSVVLDPMCGSGTILIECKMRYPSARCIGVDMAPEHVEGAQLNAESAGVENIEFRIGDVCRLDEVVHEEVDAIVTNPPYGIREKALGGLERVYKCLFLEAERMLKAGGRLCLISPRRRLIWKLSSLCNRLTPVLERKIFEGGLRTSIYVFEKIG